MYTVAYSGRESLTLDEYSAMVAVPKDDVELEDIRAVCRTYRVTAELYDKAGHSKGWVRDDGTAQVR